MSFKRFFSPLYLATPLAAAMLTLATPAFADTVTFGSYAGTAPKTLSNGTITYDNTGKGAPSTSQKTGAVSVYKPWYSNTIAGTTWVSYDDDTICTGDNGGITAYSTSFMGSLQGAVGSISMIADDTVSAYLNGIFLGTTAPTVYDTLKTFTIAAGDYKDGLNTFLFDVKNNNGTTTNGGPTGFDFKATAVSPEPSSLILLGTGALSLAGMMRRKLMA